MLTITSLQNEQVKMWRSLKTAKGRAAHGLFLAEGEHLAGEALGVGRARTLLVDAACRERYGALLEQAARAGTPVAALATHVMAAVCDAKTPQGVAAAAALPDAPPLERLGGWVVALDGVQDPGNVGTILRTADAAGFTGALLTRACADPFSPKALRASMGGVFRVPVRMTDDLARALSRFDTVIAGELGGESFYARENVRGRVCLVIGNEGAGVSPAVSAAATHHLALPMRGGAESLNAAVAAGIMMYELTRERA